MKSNKMEKLLIILACMQLLSGCASFPVSIGQNQRIAELEAALSSKDKEIAALGYALKEKEAQLQERDKKIERLRKRLESLGVFTD